MVSETSELYIQGSAQESVSIPDLMGILDLGEIGYTRWHEGKRLDEGIRLAWV